MSPLQGLLRLILIGSESFSGLRSSRKSLHHKESEGAEFRREAGFLITLKMKWCKEYCMTVQD